MGPLLRAVAGVLDGVCATMVAMAIARGPGVFFSLRASLVLREVNNGEFWRGTIPMLVSAGGPLFFGIPFASVLVGLCEIFAAATPGKMVVGIHIRRSDGEKPDRKRLVARFAAKRLGVLLVVTALVFNLPWLAGTGIAIATITFVGSFGAAASPRLALHDLVAGTAVFRIPREKTGRF